MDHGTVQTVGVRVCLGLIGAVIIIFFLIFFIYVMTA